MGGRAQRASARDVERRGWALVASVGPRGRWRAEHAAKTQGAFVSRIVALPPLDASRVVCVGLRGPKDRSFVELRSNAIAKLSRLGDERFASLVALLARPAPYGAVHALLAHPGRRFAHAFLAITANALVAS